MGAICGDIIGSFYEFHSTKSLDFEIRWEYSKFTDDTVMSVATADWIMSNDDLRFVMQDWGRNRYPWLVMEGCFVIGFLMKLRNPTTVLETVLQ